MDKNKDGSISRDEAKGTPLEKDFSKLDKDGDGKLSRDEQAGAKAGAGATTPEAPKKQ
jgi:Ca2+-binding EF-hand superfamily protein